MSSKRKEYQRTWVSNKRRRLNRNMNTMEIFDSSNSNTDSETDAEVTAVETASCCRSTCNALSHPIAGVSGKRNADSEPDIDSLSSSSEEDSWGNIDARCDILPDSSDSDNDDCKTKLDFRARLQAWAVDCKVTFSQLDKLLPILKDMDNTLPVTGKTLLKTSFNVSEVGSLSGGDYIYVGLEKGIHDVLKNNLAALDGIGTLQLSFNIDGVPLFNSSNYSLWPVLCSVINVKPCSVFLIALYGGKTKPVNLDFLMETVDELRKLIQQGIQVNGNYFGCEAKFCVCDAPARAMVKCTKLYSGYFGCDKCFQRGKFVGRMTYPECEAVLRDDESFRLQVNVEHHTGTTPFSQLPVDMISFFPIDYMHQVCLGVMRRLLVCWTSGSKKFKLSAGQKLAISTRMQVFRHQVTCDFARKPRTLAELPHWKATEYRTFLLYIGYFVLQKIANDSVVNHFLAFTVALRILVSKKLSNQLQLREFAHNLLLYFVDKSEEIYGSEFLVYNVHTLVHLAKEVELFGCLDNCSAFRFENFNQILKKCARSANNPVLQVTRRLQEHSEFGSLVSNPSTSSSHSELRYISSCPPDNCFVLDDGQCGQVVSKSEQIAKCIIYREPEPVYLTPIDSRYVGIFKVIARNGHIKNFPLDIQATKAICYGNFSSDCLVFIEILHFD